MKKIIFSTMIASLLAFVGCQNEELVNDNNTDNSGKKVILTANIQGAADSRVALTPDTDENENPIVKVDWRTFDSTNPETFEVYDLDELNDPTTFTQLSGNVFEGTLPESNNGYCAYYNDDLWTSIRNTGEFPQDGTLREQDVLMYAEFDDATSIVFNHRTAILKPTFTLGGESINSTITDIELDGLTLGEMVVDITVTRTSQEMPLAENIYMTIPILHAWQWTSFKPGRTFAFSVKAGDKDYTGSLTIPQIDGWNPYGKLFTATINLTEVITYCYLPSGAIFNVALCDILDENPTVTSIEFVAGSNLEGTEVYDKNVSTSHVELNYKIVNNTLQLHTSANKFKFPENCSEMFCGDDGDETSMDQITTIQFNDCIYTSEVTNMSEMFYDCQALTTIDLSSFNTSKVTEMIGMFCGCSSLTSLDLSFFNTSNVTTMNSMFASSGLQSITFGESFNTSKVTSMLRMFENCSALTTINFSGFNTSNVTSMGYMFSCCSSLTTLDLSSFTAELVGNMYSMFYNCTKLEKLYLQNFKPTTPTASHYYMMFRNVGSEFTSGTTQIYVATPNPFEEKSTGINTDINGQSVTPEYAEYVIGTPQ